MTVGVRVLEVASGSVGGIITRPAPRAPRPAPRAPRPVPRPPSLPVASSLAAEVGTRERDRDSTIRDDIRGPLEHLSELRIGGVEGEPEGRQTGDAPEHTHDAGAKEVAPPVAFGPAVLLAALGLELLVVSLRNRHR